MVSYFCRTALELVFVKLPKFTKTLEEVETLTDQWISFIKNVRRLETIPETMAQVPEIRQAFELANQGYLTREQVETLDHQEIYIHDHRNAIKLAWRQGFEQGIKMVRKQSIKLGREQEKQSTREVEQLTQQEQQRAKLIEERLRSLGVDSDSL